MEKWSDCVNNDVPGKRKRSESLQRCEVLPSTKVAKIVEPKYKVLRSSEQRCKTVMEDSGRISTERCGHLACTNHKASEVTTHQVQEDCFICLLPLTVGEPGVALPCSARCNPCNVHASCIYEWSKAGEPQIGESAQAHAAPCPLCRQPLDPMLFPVNDTLGTHKIGASTKARRQFLTSQVPKEMGVARCYIRVIPGRRRSITSGGKRTTEETTRLELYLQAPSTLEYPLGPLPRANGPTPGDVLIAVAHKRRVGNQYCARIDLANQQVQPPQPHVDGVQDSVTQDSSCEGSPYMGRVYSSLDGLEHKLVGPSSKNTLAAGKVSEQQLGAVRYIHTSGVGPRRIHVCFPDGTGSIDSAGNCDNESKRKAAAPASHGPAQINHDKPETRSAKRSNKSGYMFGRNKTPYWLPAIGAFSLDFKGRVTLPSNKNVQLIMDRSPTGGADNLALQFGKVAHAPDDSEIFTMDVAWPLSPMQAFSVGLSTTCERGKPLAS